MAGHTKPNSQGNIPRNNKNGRWFHPPLLPRRRPHGTLVDENLDDVYRAAMAAERDSIELYSKGLEQATDPNARAFFGVLVKAERWHLELLVNTEKYLDDTSGWHFDQEQWIVEG